MFKKFIFLILLALPFATNMLEANCCGGACGLRRSKKHKVIKRSTRKCRTCCGGNCSIR